jgi:hypothetical protein
MSEIISDDIIDSLNLYPVYSPGGYGICVDVLVDFCENLCNNSWGAYTGLASAPFTIVVRRWKGSVYSLCPTSGIFVYYCADNGGGSFSNKGIVVADLF